MRPNLNFRSIKLKKLYRRAVVHDKRDRDALGRAVGLYKYLLSGNRCLNVIHDKGRVRDGLDQFRQGAVGVKLHPFHAVRTLKIPGGVELVLRAVVLCWQRSVRENTDVMVTKFRHDEKEISHRRAGRQLHPSRIAMGRLASSFG